MVDVRVFGPLWEHLESSMGIDLDDGGFEVTVADVLGHLGIDSAEVGIVTVNGRQSNLDDIVPGDSRVCVFPPMSGG